MARMVTIVLALSALAAPAAQPSADPLLSRLEGRWAGAGTVLNQPAQSRWNGRGRSAAAFSG